MEDYRSGGSDYDYLVANGPYLYYGQNSQGPTGLAPGEKGAHRFGMQSWWGDWFANESSRVNLFGDENMSLTWIYAGRWDTQYLLFPLGMNKTYGEALKLSANYEWNEYFTGSTTGSNYLDRRSFLRNLVGDPTLRMWPVPPAQNLTATPNGADIDLAWNEPADLTEFVEYRVYRAPNLLGDFTLIATGLTGTGYTDSAAPAGPNVYMVQAVHKIETGSGTFLNNAQGVFAGIGLTMDQLILPAFPAGEDVDMDLTVSGANGTPTWSLIEGKLPPGMELLSSGKLQGNPVTPGHYRVTLQVVDQDGVPVQQEYSILVDAEFTEIVNLDLRGDGLGIEDKTQFQRRFSVWGNPVVEADGMVFSGDGDAIQIHKMGEGNTTHPGYEMLPYGYYRDWSIVLSFKAEPSSASGTLISRAINFAGDWASNQTNFAVRMSASGQIFGQITTRRITSSGGFNDGQWHQLVFQSNGDLYVDNQFIGSLSPASKWRTEDILVGARWDGAGGTAIADEFNGSLRNLIIYNSRITPGLISSHFDRFKRDRADITPHAPHISGLPSTVVFEPDDSTTNLRFPFQMTDPDGEPVKAVLIPSSLDDVQHYEVLKVETGYELVVSINPNANEDLELLIAAEDGWPGHTDVHTVNFRFSGGTEDAFTLPPGLATLDVLANDLTLSGQTMALTGIPQQPVQGFAEVVNGKVAFYPPANWNTEVTLQYELTFSPSGETRNVKVTLTPSNVPTPAPDSVEMADTAPILIDALANDTDPNGETLTLVAVEQPAGGSTRITGGQIEYTPGLGLAVFPDQFAYIVRNDTGFTAQSTISVSRTDIVAGPVVELLLNESSGSAAPNTGSLGGSADGLVHGTADWATGIEGNALSFDGTSTYVDLGNPEAMNFNPDSDSFSVVMALKFPAALDVRTNPLTLLSKQNDAGDTQFVLAVGNPPANAGEFQAGALTRFKDHYFRPYDLHPDASFQHVSAFYWRYIDDDGDSNDADWRLVSVIHDADSKQLSVYVDHWLVAQADTSGFDFDQDDTGSNWLLGARPDGSGGVTDLFTGVIDHVRIYDRAISPLEIKSTLRLVGLPDDLAPLPAAVPFYPNDSSTYTTGKPYTFVPSYIDPESLPEDIEIRWVVRQPNRNFHSFYTHDLNFAFDTEGTWRIYYEMNRVGESQTKRKSETLDLDVGPTENIAQPLQLSSSGLLSINAGDASPLALAASNGSPPYTFTLSGGALPDGLTLNTDGTITGATSQTGLFAFRVTVTDSVSERASANRQIKVGPPDTDGDGLPDEWETSIYGDLGMGPGDVDPLGYPALLRFALGMETAASARSPFKLGTYRGIAHNGDNSYTELEYQRRRDLAGNSLVVKHGTDLANWEVVDVDPVIIEDDGEIQTLHLRIPNAGYKVKFFVIEVH